MHLKISGQVLYVKDSRPTEGEKKWPLILSRSFPCFLRLLHNAYTYSLPLRLLPYAYTFCVCRYCGNGCGDGHGEPLRDSCTAQPPTLTISVSASWIFCDELLLLCPHLSIWLCVYCSPHSPLTLSSSVFLFSFAVRRGKKGWNWSLF
jgi:hypothetical protein